MLQKGLSKKISELQVGDTVIGTHGPAKVVKVINEYVPQRMFKIKFTAGTVKCSGDHLWSVYIGDDNAVLTASEIFSSSHRDEMKFGLKNGPTIITMKEIKPEPVCCIDIDSDDKLFSLDLENGSVFTHNCQFRAACGRLGSIASMMLFGNTMATTIDGSHPGAGMISANGSISSIQYYYESIDWIQNFYKKCGYDNTGHRPAGAARRPSASDPANRPTEEELGPDVTSVDEEDDFISDFSDINDSLPLGDENSTQDNNDDEDSSDDDFFDLGDGIVDTDENTDSDSEDASDIIRDFDIGEEDGDDNSDSNSSRRSGTGQGGTRRPRGSGASGQNQRQRQASSSNSSNSQLSEQEEYMRDLDNIFQFEHDISTIEIEGISGEVDKTKRQKFEG